MEMRQQLPEHPVASAAAERAAIGLWLDGLVEKQLFLTPADLADLPRLTLREAFRCEEGWSVPNLTWRGVRLADVLAKARPLANGRFVRVRAGEYAVPFDLTQIGEALLCDELNGAPLAIEHGAPWRLVIPGQSCFTSVKWVSSLEMTAEPGSNDGERIAKGRLKPQTA